MGVFGFLNDVLGFLLDFFGPWMDFFGLWVAAILTLCIYSFLYKDNPFYRFAEHLFVGISVGYGIVIAIHQGVIPLAWEPLAEAFDGLWIEITGDVTPESRQALWGLFRIIPIFIGLLFFARLSPTYTWLIRYPIAILIGFGAGVTIPDVLQANIFKQTQGTVAPFDRIDEIVDPTTLETVHTFDPSFLGTAGAVLMVIGVLCTISYFLFSVEQRESYKWFSIFGIGLGVIGLTLLVVDNIITDGLTLTKIVGFVLMFVGVLGGAICTVLYFLSSVEQRNTFNWLPIIGVGFFILFIIGFIGIYGNTIWSGNLTPWEVFSAVLIVVGVFCTLTYFFFSVEHSGAIRWTSKIGIAFLMIGFGAAFGNTVMGRLALLIHRVGFLINDWIGSIVALFG